MNENNPILENIQKIKGFKEDITAYLISIIKNDSENFYEDEITVAKLIEKENAAFRYLIVQKNDGLKVYCESQQYKRNPFEYANIRNNTIYSSNIINIPNEEYLKFQESEMFNGLDKEKESIKRLIKLQQKRVRENNPFKVTNSIFAFKDFFEIVGKPQFLKNYVEKKNWSGFLDSNEEANLDIEKITYYVDTLEMCAKNNKFDKKNRYEFNDLDNHVWMQNNKLCLSSQNVGYVVDRKESDISIYVYPINPEILKENIELKDLITKIENNQTNDIKNSVLKIIDKKIVYIEPYVINEMVSDLMSSVSSLEEEGLINIKMLSGEKLMSPDEYTVNSIYSYPTLYLKYSFEDSKIRVLDHFFNTIGNGNDKFEKSITGKPIDFSVIEDWFGYRDVFEIEKNGNKKIVFEDEKDEGYKIEKSKEDVFVPYPNFSKKYSIVHSEDFKNSDDSWKKEAVFFYRYCKDFFQDEKKYQFYNRYFEIKNLTQKNKLLISEMKNIFLNLSIEDISSGYKVEFIGDKANDKDISIFLENRWLKEKDKIEKFIDETISMLEMDLSEVKIKKIRPK